MLGQVKYLVTLSMLVFLSGCYLTQPKPDDPLYAPIAPEKMRPPPTTEGGIYQSGYSLSLFDDNVARRIGDVLTVVLIEETQASKDATSSLKKKTKEKMDNPTILGGTADFNGPNALSADGRNSLALDIKSDATFDGGGSSKQKNKITGTISVTVSDVLPNGNLVVRGEKWMTLNQGEEFVRLTGIVRPADISSDNSVLSTRVANARIAYSGRGQLADSNLMGWLGKFFISGLWLF